MSIENNHIELTFPDGELKSFPIGINAEKIAEGISPGLAKIAVAARVNDHLVGLHEPIKESGPIRILTFNDEEGQGV